MLAKGFCSPIAKQTLDRFEPRLRRVSDVTTHFRQSKCKKKSSLLPGEVVSIGSGMSIRGSCGSTCCAETVCLECARATPV